MANQFLPLFVCTTMPLVAAIETCEVVFERKARLDIKEKELNLAAAAKSERSGLIVRRVDFRVDLPKRPGQAKSHNMEFADVCSVGVSNPTASMCFHHR